MDAIPGLLGVTAGGSCLLIVFLLLLSPIGGVIASLVCCPEESLISHELEVFKSIRGVVLQNGLKT